MNADDKPMFSLANIEAAYKECTEGDTLPQVVVCASGTWWLKEMIDGTFYVRAEDGERVRVRR